MSVLSTESASLMGPKIGSSCTRIGVMKSWTNVPKSYCTLSSVSIGAPQLLAPLPLSRS